MANQEEYDVRGEMLIRREEQKLERNRVKAKAFEENMENTIARLLKKESVKRALARDAIAATKDPSRRDVIFDKAMNGAYDDDREIITGLEPRPWED